MDYKDSHVFGTRICGTIGHVAPEYLSTGKASIKTDVFGYGVMLLELITGQRGSDLARRYANDDDVMLVDWVKNIITEGRTDIIVDEDLRGNYVLEELEKLVQLALICTQFSPNSRPHMSEVVRMLQDDNDDCLVEMWDKFVQDDEVRRAKFVQDEEARKAEYCGKCNHHHSLPDSTHYLPDSTHYLPDSTLCPEELSGPR